MNPATQTQSNIQTLLLDQLADEKFVKPQIDRSNNEFIDLQRGLRDALSNPINYPAFSDSVFAGDQVAIAIQNGLPDPLPVVELLINELRAMHIGTEDIAVIIGRQSATTFGFNKSEIETACESDTRGEPHPLTRTISESEIQFQIHNGSIDAALAYVAANEAGDPIHVNRLLVDADVILPVGFPMAGNANSNVDCLYPDFASEAVQTRFEANSASDKERLDEIQLANDSLGSFFSIQIVRSPGGNIQQIFSGVRNDTVTTARAAAEKLWEFDWPKNTDVTVATIETTIGQPDWNDFTQAVLTAARLSLSGSPIIVWSEINSRPNRAIKRALLAQFEETTDQKLSAELRQLAAILRERPVYLHSRLSRDEIESVGLGYVDSSAEINRIAEPRQHGLLLRDGHLW